jgi:hypothetical protein
MRAELNSPENLAAAKLSAINVAIIYEDFASGTRARHFAERLADGLEGYCPLSESLWRSELLEVPAIAAEASRRAANCDYLIISQRGDRLLFPATRRWIEAQLDDPALRCTGLIILSDSSPGKWRVVESTCRYLRSLCNPRACPFSPTP